MSGYHHPSAHLRDIESRAPDGSGNNIANPDWGKAFHHFIRATPNSYPDGVGTEWDLPVQNTGFQGIPPNPPQRVGDLPQPRAISDAIFDQPAGEERPSAAGINEYHQFFGQFLTHDVAEAGVVSVDPPLFLDGLPFPFTRTPFVTIDGVRQQENDETSWLDLSSVYGSSAEILGLVRARDGNGGLSARLLAGATDDLLPTMAEVAAHHGRTLEEVESVLSPNQFIPFGPDVMAAGDDRAAQQTPLLTHHLTWMRNHNWHVDRLKAMHPDWSEEALFEAARALNEAEWQHVVYSEYVPKLIGEDALAKYAGYRPEVDGSIINEWTTVAFRFGHDQSSDDLAAIDENGAVTRSATLAELFGVASDGMRSGADADDWIRGQLARTTQEIDGRVVDGNRKLLFGPQTNEIDLTVFDVQRGRDHGVGNYNALRKGLGLAEYASFDAWGAENGVEAGRLAALKALYGDDIGKFDAYVGGLMEKKAEGSQLGETFTILNVMQFEALRDGDRFYYEERLKDHPELIEMVENVTLADIIARTSGIEHVYHDAFRAHERMPGTDGADEMWGTGAHELIMGHAGDDRLFGEGGHDDVHGGDGDDQIWGHAGNDHLHGGAGNDGINGDDGADHAWGGEGDDAMWGGAGDDALHGGRGDDSLNGDDGEDALHAGHGNDMAWGGAGHDVLHAGHGDDTALGEGGDDHVHGEHGDDWLWGGDGHDHVHGGHGADAVHGDDGHDVVHGGHGDDRAWGGAGRDHVDGGDGDDAVHGDAGNDVVYGGTGNDSVWGGAGNDWVGGGDGDDLLYGDAGNDVMEGGAGTDVMLAGDGADIFRFTVGCGVDTAADLYEGDRVDLSDFGFAGFDAVMAVTTQQGDDAVIDLGGGDAAILSWTDRDALTADQFILTELAIA